jgi:hypothetical protein
MERRSKFDAAIEFIWFDGNASKPYPSKHESIFKNFDSETLYEKTVSQEFITTFGDEIYMLVNEALKYCSEWHAIQEDDQNMEFIPTNNFHLIQLSNWTHDFFYSGCDHSDWSFYPFSSIDDSDDWREYISLVSEGYDATENKSWKPSQLIGICVLFMIDRACTEIRNRGFNKKSTSNLLTAHRFLHAAEISSNEFYIESAVKYASSESARKKAMERHAKDPKQVEKKFVFECWEEWQRKPENYSGQAAFARDMLNKCKELTSQKKIEDWCRDWKKAAK